ncbi:hypothetical protein [Pseudobutyrivibrio ruminis]|uniref:hypothetical protein n=1 Tax=Pseudobutyrivibrio ruminis TaxID=46206 RepID=UPI000410554E|nr:hypothetical protein [Pseudobutyrivibrio ruminis]
MKKINSILKTLFVCLFTVVIVGANTSFVSFATEVEAPEAQAEQVAEEPVAEVQAAPAPAEGSAIAIVEVESYTIEGGMLEAGKDVTVNFNLHNTSSSSSATSIIMTMNSSSGMIYPVYGTDNQIYVGSIGAGKTKTVSVPVTVSSFFRSDSVDITCQFDYITSNNKMANTSTIVIPASGGTTLGVKSIDLSSHAIVNGKSLLSFRYANNSEVNITDAKLVIEGNVSKNSKAIKLDTVYAGKSYNKDFYVTFVEDGDQEITVTLEYTDIDGEEVSTTLGTYRILVSKETEEDIIPTSDRVLSLAGKVGALVVLVCAAFVVFKYIKKH